MAYNYCCPSCKGHILVNDYITLSVKKRNGDVGLVLLSPEPGNYHLVTHATLDFKKGEILEVYCPICHHNLICIPEKNLARVMLEEETGELLTMLFSVVFGEHKTYQLDRKKKKVSHFGEHSGHFDFESLLFCL